MHGLILTIQKSSPDDESGVTYLLFSLTNGADMTPTLKTTLPFTRGRLTTPYKPPPTTTTLPDDGCVIGSVAYID